MSKQPPPYSEVPQSAGYPPQQSLYPPLQPQPGFTPATTYQPPPTMPMPMPQPAPPQQSTVIITTTLPGATVPISNSPTHIRCPSCHAEVLTTVKHQPNSCTHIWALVLCLFICWPCVCLPYCMDSCQNANHYCPNCNAYIGTYQP